jgi:hypothetical protein
MSHLNVRATHSIPDEPDLSRVYRHDGCGQLTTVSGDDYVILECPFRPVTGTFCCGCHKFVPLHTVSWADTGESIAKYRTRVAASVPFWRRVRLALFGSAYEGAIHLHLDRKGRRLHSPEGRSVEASVR